MRTNSTDIADFYRQISLLLKSGLPLPDSIYQLGKNFDKADFKEVLFSLSDETKKGESLSGAMKEHSAYFTDFHIRMIETGEKGKRRTETSRGSDKPRAVSIILIHCDPITMIFR